MTIGTIFCNQCGAQNSTTAQFCANCGAGLANALPVSNRVPAGGATPLGVPLTSPVDASAPTNPVLIHTGYGGFWIRLVAAVIDGIVVQAVVTPVVFVVGMVVGVAGAALSSAERGFSLATLMIGAAFGFFASWLYEAVMESSSRQATLGKMIFGMKVTDLQGNRISFGRATARHFSKYLSAMILFFGYIIAGFTAQKQALHDMIAGTVVRRG